MGIKVRSRVRARAGPKSGPREFKIVKHGILRASLFYIVAQLFYIMALEEVKNLFSLLKIVEPCKRFFQQVVILEQNKAEKSFGFIQMG